MSRLNLPPLGGPRPTRTVPRLLREARIAERRELARALRRVAEAHVPAYEAQLLKRLAAEIHPEPLCLGDAGPK